MKRLPCSIAVLILTSVMLCACVTPRPQVNSVADAIIVSSADIESAAQTVQNLCGNTEPGGPCAAGSLISTTSKNSYKRQLQDALDGVKTANRLLAAGNATAAGNRLDQVDAIVLALTAELARRQ